MIRFVEASDTEFNRGFLLDFLVTIKNSGKYYESSDPAELEKIVNDYFEIKKNMNKSQEELKEN